MQDILVGLAAWRLTASGRPLMDRQRRRRVEKNLPDVVRHLTEVCTVMYISLVGHVSLAASVQLGRQTVAKPLTVIILGIPVLVGICL